MDDIIYDPSILGGQSGPAYDPSILDMSSDQGRELYIPPEQRPPEVTADRIAGRFFQTVKSAPGRAAAAHRNRIEAMDSDDMASRIRNASAGQTFATGTDWMEEAGLVKVQARKAALIDEGYHPDAAEQMATIEHVEEQKQKMADDMRATERQFSMPGKYDKSSGFLEDVAGGLGTSVVSLPAYALHPLIGALTTYDQIAGAKVQELEKIGLTDPVAIMESARVSAAIQTPLEAVSDLFILSRILKPMGKWTSALVSVGQSMVGEGATEFVQQYPDEFATMMAVNPDLSDRELWTAFYERLPEITGNAGYAGLVGSVSGGLTTGVGITGHATLDRFLTPKQRIENDAKLEKVTRLVNKAKEGTISEDEFASLKKTLGINEDADMQVDDVVADVEQRIKIAAPIVSDNRARVVEGMGQALGEDKARPIIDLMDGAARAWARRNDKDPKQFYEEVLGGFERGDAGAFVAAQTQKQGALYQGPRTLGGRIREAGGINFLHFKGERKNLPDGAKKLSRKDGVPIDLLEQALRDEGWLEPEEDLLDALTDPKALSRENRNAMEMDEQNLEEPPDGDYRNVSAEKLPAGKQLVIIHDNLENGWGVLEVVTDESDPFEVVLRGEGQELILTSTDQVDMMELSERDQFIDRNKPRGAITNLFNDLPKIIHAFESADASTPIHEVGHLLTKMLADERSDDYFALSEWAGVDPDRASAGLDGWKEEELERVARAFEAYVMEGQAPTLKLRDIFRMMRDWLLDIYKSMRALDVELTDNVRGVFDRLLAADFERQDDLAAEVNEWLATGNLDDDGSFNTIMATPREIEREAIRRVANEGAKERRKREKEIKARFRKRAKAEVDEYPYFKMMAEARASGLSIDMLKDAFDEKTVKALLQKLPGTIRAGGDDIYKFASDHGYLDLETLINDILGAPTKTDAIQEHFDALWGQYRQGLAVENADLYIRALKEQEKIIAEMTGESARKAMRDITGDQGGPVNEEQLKKLIHDFKRDKEIARSAYAAGREDRPAKLKKLQQTIAKQAQRMQQIRDAQKARADREKIDKRMRRIWRSKSLTPEYRAQITHFLSEYYNIPQSFMITPDEPLEAFLQRKEETEAWLVDSIRAELTRKPVQDRNEKTGYRIPLDDDQRAIVANIADMLAHMGRVEGKLIKAKKKEDLLQTVVDMSEPMLATHGSPGNDFDQPRVPSARRLGWWDRMSDNAKRYLAELRKAEFIFQAADGWKEFGPNWKNLFLPIKAAEDAELEMGEKVMQKIKAAFENLGADRKWALKKYEIDGFADRLTKEEMIMIALNSGNAGNLTALREGFGWSDEMIAAVHAELTEAEVQLVDDIWTTIDELYPHLDRVHMELTGVHLPKVEGRYFPLVFDRDLAWKAGQFAEEARQRDMFATAYTRPSVQAGHRKTRTGGKMAPQLSFSVISRHIVSAVHDATHQIAVRNAQQIIAHPVYRGAMSATMGDSTYRQLMPWLQDVASPRREPATQVDKWVGRLRRNSTIVGLGLKFTVAIKQWLSYTQTIDELGPGRALSGLAEFYGSPRRMTQFIRESSVMIRQRKGQWDRELNQFAREFDPSVSTGLEKAKDAFFWMIGMMDIAATYPTWLASYRANLDRTGDHKQAVEYADMVVRRTQPVASPKDMSTMQRGGETRSELRKLFTMFYTFFSVFQNRLQETTHRWKLGDINTTQAIMSYWWIMVLPALLSTLIAEREWPWEIKPYKYLAGLASYGSAAFPYLRDLASPFLTGFGYTLTPVEGAGKAISQTPMAVVDLFTGDSDKKRKAVKKLVSTTGYTVGLPSSQINITMDGVIDLMQDKTDNPWRLIFSEQAYKKKKDLLLR